VTRKKATTFQRTRKVLRKKATPHYLPETTTEKKKNKKKKEKKKTSEGKKERKRRKGNCPRIPKFGRASYGERNFTTDRKKSAAYLFLSLPSLTLSKEA